MSKRIGDFTLMNEEKFNRTMHGSLGRSGQLVGGVGDGATDAAILAEYDRLGGLIMKGELKVKSGSFFDVRAKKPREVPQVEFIINVDGEFVEGTEEEAQAVQNAKARIKQIRSGKGATSEQPGASEEASTEEEAQATSKGKRGRKAIEE